MGVVKRIQNREEFIRKTHELIDGIGGGIRLAENPIRYMIILGKQVVNIADKDMEGIVVSAMEGDYKVLADPVYNWSDAYTLAYMLILQKMGTELGDIDYYEGKEGEVLRINSLKTIQKKSFDFYWNPGDRMLDFPDHMIHVALSLVKCGAIVDVSIKTSEKGEQIHVVGKRALCAPAGEEVLNREGKSAIFPSAYFSGVYEDGKLEELILDQEGILKRECEEAECQKTSCLLGLCGYLEYLYRNGRLYSLLLERKNLKIPTGNFGFTWKPKSGLKAISEPVFYAANMLVDLGQMVVEEELGENYKIRCRASINISESKEYLTMAAIVNHINTYANPPEVEYTIELEKDIEEGCNDNVFVFVAAAYIYYLRKSNQDSVIQSDRDYYHKYNRDRRKKYGNCFEFELSAQSFSDVSRELWELAYELQRKCYVSLGRNLVQQEQGGSGCVIYHNGIRKNDTRSLKTLHKEVENQVLNRMEYAMYTVYNPQPIDLEKIFCEQKWSLVIGFAAFIDYLDSRGELPDFEKRLYTKWEEEKAAIQKSLEKIDNEIVDKMVVNPDCNTLYCVIQGEDGTGRKNKAIAIAKKLLEVGKITHFEEIDDVMSFEMASYKLQHSSMPHEENISAKISRGVEGEPITMEDLRSTLFLQDNNNTLKFYAKDLITEKVTFRKKRIYILTNLRDFLPSCENAKIGDNSRAAHLMECLGKYNKETYIILIDEKKYIQHLFSLFPQIKYLFGSTMISTDSLTEKEIYHTFKKNLQAELKEELAKDQEYEQSFLDFCARNRKNFAMKNRELAEFLANYSNIHHDIRRMFEAMEIYSSKSTDELLEGVIGMKNVKQKVKEFKQYAIYRKYADNKGMHIPNSNMHMLFTGNPGTGKTMIARIIGQILYDAGIIEENKVIEVEGKDLKGRYIGESGPKTAAKIDEAIGGVLFIDEAYAIGDDAFGKEVIATLIKSMEDRKDQFVVIFAGYPKEMQEFININSGINSRIGYKFQFEDYSETELLKIFNSKMQRAGYEYSDSEEVEKRVLKLCKVFSRKKDFGNGRFVDKVIQQTVIGRATRDYTLENVNVISPEDIPSEEQFLTTDVVEHIPYQKQLDAIVGMENVKKKIEEFAKYVKFKKYVEEINPQVKIPASNMHMIFTGNPGTGKTTIARIMVDLLYDVGIIKERKYIEVERKDLVGEHIGKTAMKTGEVIERAINGVLFIDEAYSLAVEGADNDFGSEAIATLIKAMEDHKESLIVIFAGYKDEMRRFEKINPGIASRIGYRFEFKDYSSDELVEMFSKQVTGAGFSIDADALKHVRTVLDYYRRKQNFGNGRFVARLWQDTLTKHSGQYNESTVMRILEKDIPTVAEMNNTTIKKSNHASLEHIIGLQQVKEQMKVFETWVNFSMDAREKGIKIPATSLHMIFTGNPGTGKTTVARIVAQKLYDLGVIMENKVIEADRSSLVGKYVGETALKTHDVIESAMGGVLFIDEAYMLAEEGNIHNYGAEAVNTLMKVMEDKKDEFVVIFAGYEKEMKDFLAINPGIESRIGYTFRFEDYNGEELLEIFERKMEDYGFIVDEKAKKAALKVFRYFSQVPNFGNGRFVDKVIRQTLMNQSGNYDFDTMSYIGEENIPNIEEMKGIMGCGSRPM